MNLREIRNELCVDAKSHCRVCFSGKAAASLQCPPNVFRICAFDETKLVTFVFDKPNDNTPYKTSPLIPLETFDDRAGVDGRLVRAPSHQNLLILCRLLGVISDDSEHLSSPYIHITNAVKCDMSSDTGRSGRIVVSDEQAKNCVTHFLSRELNAVKSQALVFFGKNAQIYVLKRTTPLWEIQTVTIEGRLYKTMRVPHTSPPSFNTYGGRGENYVEPYRRLMAAIS